MSEPQPYNVNDSRDLARWFREMKGYLMSQNGNSTKCTPGDVICAIQNLICTRCPVQRDCLKQSESDRFGSLIMCITHGPADYCDEDYFTEVPILGDPRIISARERDQE